MIDFIKVELAVAIFAAAVSAIQSLRLIAEEIKDFIQDINN